MSVHHASATEKHQTQLPRTELAVTRLAVTRLAGVRLAGIRLPEKRLTGVRLAARAWPQSIRRTFLRKRRRDPPAGDAAEKKRRLFRHRTDQLRGFFTVFFGTCRCGFLQIHPSFLEFFVRIDRQAQRPVDGSRFAPVFQTCGV